MDTSKYLITILIALVIAFGVLGFIGKAITKSAERTAETIGRVR